MNSQNGEYVFDLAREEVFPVGELFDHVNYTRRGRKPHKAAAYRSISPGKKAHDGTIVQLATFRGTAGLMTSVGAFQAFLDRLSACGAAPAASQAIATRERAAERANRELELAGF